MRELNRETIRNAKIELGEEFVYEKRNKLKCVKHNNTSCCACFFYKMNCENIICRSFEQIDGESVIFIPIK